jgi:phosphatidylserine/phosphatidylglycerophosphate/cardiolipin synthase-like enzyme
MTALPKRRQPRRPTALSTRHSAPAPPPPGASVPAAQAPELHVYANTSAVFLTWDVPGVYQPLNGAPCVGYRIERLASGQTVILTNSVGFAGLSQAAMAQAPRPSDKWPLQRYTWTDFTAPVNEQLSYRVTPMFGSLPATGDTLPALQPGTPSRWQPIGTPMDGRSAVLESYFNFGIVASPWFTAVCKAVDPNGALSKIIFAPPPKKGAASTPGTDLAQRSAALNQLLDKPLPKNPAKTVRQALGGALLAKIYALLDEVAANQSMQIYAALFELNEPGVIQRLKRIGKRAHVILGNGSHKTAADDPEAATAKEIASSVDLYRRKFSASGAYVHNKFIVFVEDSKPVQLWTGSTNLTSTGCCGEVQNALLVGDADIATQYFNQWNWLKDCGNVLKPPQPPAQLKNTDTPAGKTHSTIYFTPTGTRRKDGTTNPNPLPDLGYASHLISQAQNGILCLFFEPGPKGTLLNAIVDTNQARPGKLYVRGVVNADPSTYRVGASGTAQGTRVVGLLHQDKGIPASFDIVLPSALGGTASPYFNAERAGFDLVRIHSKVVVIDPLGSHPAVITGSHNLGPKASTANDENLVIIEGDALLAQEYAAHVMSVFNHFWYRFNVSPSSQKYADPGARLRGVLKTTAVTPWGGLERDGSWQNKYFTPGSPEALEFQFWCPRQAE